MKSWRIARALHAGAAGLWMRLWSELSVAERRRLRIALAAMLVASGLTAVLPLLIGELVNGSLSHGKVTLTASLDLLGLTAGLVLAGQLLEVIRRQLVENVATAFERDSRIRAYDRLLHLDLGHFREGQVGSLYGRTNRSIEGAVKLVKLGALDLLPALSLAAAALIVAFIKSPLVAAAMVGVVPTGFLLVRWQVRSQAGIRVEVRDHKDAIDGEVTELLPALETIRASGAEEHFVGRVEAGCESLRETEFRHHRAMSLFDAAKSVNEGLWLIVVLLVSLTLTASGTISAGEITAYVLLYAAVLSPLRELHRILDEAAEASLQTRDLFDLLDEEVDRGYSAEVGTAGEVESIAPDGAVLDIKGLTFAHPGLDVPVLDGLDLRVAGGERVGVVGESGCGKSTLLRVVDRLHHGYSGEMKLFGADLRNRSRAELARMVGYVAQEPRLFNMTVRENIVFGRKRVSDEEVVAAAEQAHIHATIEALPDGYDTVVAERGESLSGGQKQRICLARTLLRNPGLLLLDEPTSALDNASERFVQAAIDSLDSVSMLIVAHRLSTLRSVNRIVVLERGGIVEEGSFADLAKAGGMFSEMLAAERLAEEVRSDELGAEAPQAQAAVAA